MAGAYTVFANEGQRIQPHALVKVVGADGQAARSYSFNPEPVLSREVTYMMTDLLQGVIEDGTGVRVRSMGFSLPAAGKTGTSRDGWFAGYTKDFLAIAWVGYDDNRDLNIEGARSALPIWTEFMLRATALYPPRNAVDFDAPEDMQFLNIDKESHLPATARCPETYGEVFIPGTVPTTFCPLHGQSVSEAIESGFGAAGRGVGGALKTVGRVFSGIFGRDDAPQH
jgi:penicillin-binding protein 1B